jgi:dephospho-CoA kinase
MEEQDARKRIASQLSREHRLARASHVVCNDGDFDALRAQVDALWSALLAVRDDR